MRFVWDDEKAVANSMKHGIGFKIATFAFDDPCALILEDTKHSLQEPRQWLIGNSGKGILVVVFTLRLAGNLIRIISARRATRLERSQYEENKRDRFF
ncbi:MAG: BrnT family toxin [Elusimicrobia bacterium]|nr:BrnT family toxin [Elusimicrobiota bacterium]